MVDHVPSLVLPVYARQAPQVVESQVGVAASTPARFDDPVRPEGGNHFIGGGGELGLQVAEYSFQPRLHFRASP